MSELNNEFFTDLLKDTDFKVASVGSLMHSRKKVSTPLLVLNCIYGGGLPLGVMSEISGAPGSGKSTFLYQCMGNYQREYPDGVPVIYDMEASMDTSRLKTLGVDTNKVLRLPATSMEDAFTNMFKILKKLEELLKDHPNISSFQIYDSLAAGGTEKQHKAVDAGGNAFGAGTMMEPQRIMKQNLSNVLPFMEKYPVFLGLINQVFTHVNAYGGASLSSGGGLGLKHLCHAHIEFSNPKDEYDKNFIIGTTSEMQLKKSKLSPKIIGIPCYIDVTNGGRIHEADSFVKYLINIGLFTTGSYYKFGEYFTDNMIQKYSFLKDHQLLIKILTSSHRKAAIYDMISKDQDMRNLLQIALIDYIDAIYPAQREINDEFQKKLMRECSYFKDVDIDNLNKVEEVSEEPTEETVENEENS